MSPSLHHGDVAGHVLAHAGTQCRTIEQALALMRVLPALEQPHTFRAIRTRGFLELAPHHALRLAVKYGHTEPFELFPASAVAPESWELLRTAAEFGNVKLLQKYLDAWTEKDQRDDKDTQLFKLALNAGRVAVLEWLQAENRVHGSTIGPDDFTTTKYDLGCLKWAKSHGLLSIPTGLLVKKGLAQNQLDVVEWAITDIPKADLAAILNSEDFVHNLAYFDCNSLDWWWAHSPKFPSPDDFGAVAPIFTLGRMEAIQWWWQKFLEHRTSGHKFASTWEIYAVYAEQNLEVMTWLWDNSQAHPTYFDIDWEKAFADCILYSAKDWDGELMNWWRSKSMEFGFESDFYVDVDELAQAGKFGVLESLGDNDIDTIWPDNLHQYAFQKHDLSFLKWVDTHLGFGADKNDHFTVSGTVSAELLDMFRWWSDRYGFEPEGLEEIGGLISRSGYLPALWWWLSMLSDRPQSVIRDALGTAFAAATAPVVLDTLADFALAHGYFVHAPGGDGVPDALDDADDATRAWWSDFAAASGSAPGDPSLDVDPDERVLAQRRRDDSDSDEDSD
ncbi:hypothetical protein BC828DRAFT_391551 [Blastocladiella britannica]|nr:hypothetical protein BC828DRAFT_391551 [Blastocladiella britannica]